MKKLILSVALLMATATFSFAGNPKETKEAKAETPTEVKTEAMLNIYYVVGESGSNYQLSTTTILDCGIGNDKPCRISTNLSLGSTVAKTAVDNQVNITILEWQPDF